MSTVDVFFDNKVELSTLSYMITQLEWYVLHMLRTRIVFSLGLVLPVFQQKCELMIRIYVQ